VVLGMFERSAARWSANRIATDLNERGVLTPTQHFERAGLLMANQRVPTWWRRGTVLRMLENPTYKGTLLTYRWQKTKETREDEQTGETRTTTVVRPRALAECLSLECPAIVSTVLWEQAREQRTRNKAEAARNNHDVERALLRDYVFSLASGQRYCVRSKRAGRYALGPDACTEGGYVRTDKADADIWAKVLALLDDPDIMRRALDAYHARANSEAEADQSELRAKQESLDVFRRKRTSLLRRLEDVDDDEEERAEIEGRLAEVKKHIKKVAAELDALDAARAGRDAYTAAIDAFAELAGDITSGLVDAPADYQQKRMALRLACPVVRMYKADDLQAPDMVPWDAEFTWAGVNSDTYRTRCKTTMPTSSSAATHSAVARRRAAAYARMPASPLGA
jgi:Recombinase